MMLTKIWQKFKKIIIGLIVGGVVLGAGISGIPQDLYNNLNVKVYTACDLQSVRRTSIENDLKNFKARNPDNSLRELNASEKASIKSCEIAKRGTEYAGIYDSIQYGVRVEIIGDVNAIEINGQHGIELFARAWKGGKQLGFGKDGSVEIERFRIFNPQILVDDPTGSIISEFDDLNTGGKKQKRVREDLVARTVEDIASGASQFGKLNTQIVSGKVGNTTTLFYPDANPETNSVDGTIESGGQATWAGARDATTGTALPSGTSDAPLVEFRNANLYYVNRAFTLFLTSALSGQTITSASIDTYGLTIENGYSDTVEIVPTSPASNTDLVSGDFDNLTFTSKGSLGMGSMSTTAYVAITITDLTQISTTGVSKLGLILGKDLSNTAPITLGTRNYYQYESADTAAGHPIRLTVVHSSVATGEDYIILFE